MWVAIPLFIIIGNIGTCMRLINWKNPHQKYFTKGNIIMHILVTVIAIVLGIGINTL